MRIAIASLVVLAGLVPAVANAAERSSGPIETARGVVFLDANGNGVREAGEKGLESVRVSNGRDVVLTDREGRYELGVDDDDIVFVIKPRGYMTPVDEDHLPRFYYIHKPAGSDPSLKFKGVEPTGPLPESIDFPLRPQHEPERFQTIFFGDTQPRDVREVEYFTHDIAEDLRGFPGAFGVTLGDVVFDDLSVFGAHNQAVALIGMPWYNVLGNHDVNYDVPDDAHSDETWERVFGPATYSFDYGPVHYVVLDNVFFYRNAEDKAAYRGGFTEEQMVFMVNDLELVPKDQLVVYMMHIPLRDVPERKAFFDVIKEYPHTLSISGHTHTTEHDFFGASEGNPGPEHHHYVAVTACGSWWTGAPDERGIPHATMADGAPNGYTIITFDGAGYDMQFRAASEPADHQMRIWTPEEVSLGELPGAEIVVNVYGGSSRSTVEMRVDGGAWGAMEQRIRPDPYIERLNRLYDSDDPPLGRKTPKAGQSRHIWVGPMPGALGPGLHTVEVRTTDMFGRSFVSSRAFRVR